MKAYSWLLGRRSPFPEEFHALRCIFVHTPKNAGLAVLRALFGEALRVGHRPVRYYQRHYPEYYSDYMVLAVARDPYTRLHSAYNFLKAGGLNEADSRWAGANLGGVSTYEEFVLSLADPRQRRKILRWKHFRPQMWYLQDGGGRLGVDVLCRLETLAEDLEKVGEVLGVETSLVPVNVGTGPACRYTEEMAEIVANIYREDFIALEYDILGANGRDGRRPMSEP